MSTAISYQTLEKSPGSKAEQDLLTLQNQQLKQGKIKFLSSLQPDADKTYGAKNKPRDTDPSMKEIFSWGYEAPVKGDFIKDQTEIRYKIKKMDKEYISEIHDNYRKHEYGESGIPLFNFLDEEGQEKWKRKIYDMAVKDESDEVKKSTYQQLFCASDKQWWESILAQVTPAGKTRYLDKPKTLVTPNDFIMQKMAEKIE